MEDSCLEFFPQKRDFGGRLFELGLESATAGCPAPGDCEGDAGERDGVEDARFDVLRPLLG